MFSATHWKKRLLTAPCMPRAAAVRPRRPRRLGLELLESRLVPATWSGDVFDAAPGVPLWTNNEVQVVTGDVRVPAGKTLTVQPGTVVQFARNTSLIVDGTLTAVGTAGQTITFTSAGDNSPIGGGNTASPGDWSRISFGATSTSNVLDRVVVRYGGRFSVPMVEALNAPLTLTNSTISNADNDGVRLVGGTATLTNNTFSNNGLAVFGSPVHVDPATRLAIGGATFTNNRFNGVVVDGGTLPAGTTTWNSPGVVYWLDEVVTVPQGSTLVVGAGQIVKTRYFRNDALIVAGTLRAQGTAAAPVVFTSNRDDSAGGDTNNDGPSGGAPGDWHSLSFTPTSTNSVLDYVDVRFGYDAADGTPGMINVTGASLTVSNSIIQQSGHGGLFAGAGATLTVTNSVIVNNLGEAGVGRAGVQGTAGSTVTVTNSTIDGNSRGIILDSPTATLTNNLITNNSFAGVVQTGLTNLTMRFNDVFNPTASNGNYSGLPNQTGTNGNLSVDPKYVDRAARDFRLDTGSPVVDAGTSVGAPAADFAGNPRFDDPNVIGRGDGSGTDLGAFERQVTSVSSVDLVTTVVTGPATGLQGQTVTVTWTVKNEGTAAATGPWYDAVYLSADTVFSPDDVLLGETVRAGNLAPGQSYATPASSTITVPGVTPGAYYFLVRANARNEVFEGLNVTNNVLATTAVALDVPALALGTPTSGTLAGSGASQLYKVTVPAGANLNVALAGPAGNVNELYVAYGQAPTRQTFDARGVRLDSANQTVSLANTAAGTYYVLVYGASLPGPENFTLTASTPGFSLTGATPAQGSNTGRTTLTIDGAQFDADSVPQLVDSAGATIPAAAVYFTDSGRISATFDLTGRPTGAVTVRVVNSGGATQTLANAFTIVAGQPGRLETSLSSPSASRVGRGFPVVISYRNTGGTDLIAPIMQVTTSGSTQLSFFPDLSGAAGTLDLLGVNPDGPAGVLPPGATGRIVVYASSSAAGVSDFNLSLSRFPAAIDWATVGPTLIPANYTQAQWAQVVAQLQANLGTSFDAYRAALAADASLLPPDDGLNYSMVDVFNIEVQKALAQLEPSLSGHLYLNDTAHPLGNVGMQLFDPTSGAAFHVVSLLDGSFLVPGAGPGTYQVTFDGYVSSTATITVGSGGSSGAQIILTNGGQITGSVYQTPGGAAVPGTIVTASLSGGTTFTTATTDNGTYSLGSVPAGTYSITAGGGAFSFTNLDGVAVAAGSVNANVNLAVQPGAKITGTVTGPGGPVAGATVSATGADGTVRTAVTAADGSYSVTNLTGQTYTVQAMAAGLFGTGTGGVAVVVGGTTAQVNLSLVTAGSVSGTVTAAATGNPVSGALVTVQGTTAGFTTVTDANGNYTASELPAGSYTVAATPPNQMTVSATATVTAGSNTTVNLTVGALGQVSGTVTDSATGQPIAAVIVYAADDGGFVTSALTDAAGFYTLTGLEAGMYRVILGDESAPGLSTTTVTLDPSRTTATVNFSAALAGRVSGTVFQADGTTPIAGVTVSLVQGGQAVLSMKSDAQGHYVFDLTLAGTYGIEAASAGLAFPARVGITVGGSSEQSGLDFVAGSATLSGRVTSAATGQPIAGAVVSIDRADPGLALTGVTAVATAADGTFTASGLVPGSYRIDASAAGFAYGIQNLTVTAAGPNTASLALAAPGAIRGVVRDSTTGAALANVTVVLVGTSVSQLTITDSSGNYSFAGLAAGTYSVMFTTGGHQSAVVGSIAVTAGGIRLPTPRSTRRASP